MKIEGVREMQLSQDELWATLMDPEVLARCLPGCEQLEPTGENTFRAVLKVGIASIKGSYAGSLTLSNLNPTDSFHISMEGSGSAGFVKGTAKVKLDKGGPPTDLQYAADIQVGGLVASVGQRMLNGIATTLVHQFFVALEEEIGSKGKADSAGKT